MFPPCVTWLCYARFSLFQQISMRFSRIRNPLKKTTNFNSIRNKNEAFKIKNLAVHRHESRIFVLAYPENQITTFTQTSVE